MKTRAAYLEPWIIAIGIIFVSSVWSVKVVTQTYVIRYIAWSLVTLILLFTLMIRGKADIAVLRKYIFVAFGYYILVSIISNIKAINFGEWFFDISRIILMVVYLWAAANYLHDVRQIARPLILTAIGLGVYGLWKTNFGLVRPFYIANMGNRNLFSQYLLLLLPFCLCVTGKWRKWGIIAAVLVVSNIFACNTRAAMVGLVGSVVITAAIFNRKVLCIVLLVIITTGIIISFNKSLLSRIGNSESSRSRIATWKQSLIMTKDNFMVGAGNWKIAILPYSTGFIEKDAGDKHYMLEAHNSYIEVLSEKSIFGLIFYLSIFVMALYYAYKSRNVYVFMAITAYMLYVFFDDKQRAPHLMILVTLFAFAIGGYYRVNKVKFRYPVILIIGIISLISFAYIVRFDMELHFHRSQRARNRGNADLAISELSQIPFVKTIEKHTLPYIWFRGDAYRAKGETEKAFKDFSKAYKQNPHNIYVLLSFGEALFYDGQKEKSLELYEHVLDINPKNVIAKKNIQLIKEDKNGSFCTGR